MTFWEFLKILILGFVEGITEWLPISSTGHMLLVDEFIQLDASEEFKEMFFILIQLGAILAVLVLFWQKMWPFQRKTEGQSVFKTATWITWLKVIVACVPGAVVTILFDDWIEAHLHTPVVIALALVVYGFAFIFIEKWNQNKTPRVATLAELSWSDAALIGLFQVLSIIPGTSRSGATIVGALILGVSRVAAAEFTFFLAVPVMFGMSFLKILKFGLAFTGTELLILAVGCATAFLVSLAVIRFFMNYIKKHSFSLFGWYRIALGALVLLYFTFVN